MTNDIKTNFWMDACLNKVSEVVEDLKAIEHALETIPTHKSRLVTSQLGQIWNHLCDVRQVQRRLSRFIDMDTEVKSL